MCVVNNFILFNFVLSIYRYYRYSTFIGQNKNSKIPQQSKMKDLKGRQSLI